MIDLHADDVDSDEEPPELTDSDDADSFGCVDNILDYVVERKVSLQYIR